MPPAAFEPTAPASDRPQTHALNRAATGMGDSSILQFNLVHLIYIGPCIIAIDEE